MILPKKFEKSVQGTHRVEAFSDGIFAFSMTLLALNLDLGTLPNLNNTAVWDALIDSGPKFLIFLVSFFVISILWVNHHHFFNNFRHSNWKLMWHNLIFLLWVILIPFITNFLGDNPTQPLVISIYGIVMALAVISFLSMVYYVFFRSDLVDNKISVKNRKEEFNRGIPAVIAYILATLLAHLNIYVSLAIFALVPIWYFVPTFLVANEE